MKPLFTLLILTLTISSYGQRICDFGEYDFYFKTIKGVDKTDFSQIKLIDSTEPIDKQIQYVYKFDSNKRLMSVDFNNSGSSYAESIDTGCNSIIKATYQYNETESPKKIEIIDSLNNYGHTIYYNKHDKIEKIENKYFENTEVIYSYDEKNQLKSIEKGSIIYSYYWYENSCIKKITITDPFYTIRELKFTYSNNKISSISSTRRYKTNNIIVSDHTYLYTYNNEDLSSVKIINNKYQSFVICNYDYENEDKLIITIEGQDNKYQSHFECYY
ncbi:hypothetical protein [Olleya sp. Bg11-27]|uniref:hypothetical protein n=1 Tax=Olleya sp. Bg11-27 TaxID=2058135 RepID=UPI000C308A4F|nr:hypothetical protein [Olleya sp. Bg11-27]AUC76212.1 hypothetical protein CW732_11260 [Olleya sp. Bg11-27]